MCIEQLVRRDIIVGGESAQKTDGLKDGDESTVEIK